MTDDSHPESNPADDLPAAVENGTDPPVEDEAESRKPQPRVFGRFAIWIVVFPFVFYLSGMSFATYMEDLRVKALSGKLHDHEEESSKPQEEIDIGPLEEKAREQGQTFLLGTLPLGENSYPYGYTYVILATTVIMLVVGRGYFRAPFRIHWLSFVVGAVGVVVWIGLAYIDQHFIGIGESLSSGRRAFNPFEEMPYWSQEKIWKFVGLRFFGLVLVVPIIEEFFVRGFLMRYVDDPDWDEIPLGQAKTWGWLSPTIYGVVAHLTEPVAALVWFSLVSFVYKKTGSIWDCVVVHAVTNLLLGIYIIKFEAWHLW